MRLLWKEESSCPLSKKNGNAVDRAEKRLAVLSMASHMAWHRWDVLWKVKSGCANRETLEIVNGTLWLNINIRKRAEFEWPARNSVIAWYIACQ